VGTIFLTYMLHNVCNVATFLLSGEILNDCFIANYLDYFFKAVDIE